MNDRLGDREGGWQHPVEDGEKEVFLAVFFLFVSDGQRVEIRSKIPLDEAGI